jgi:hypothetical protein
MSTPSVSIVVPCYNARATLPDTIASLRHQTLEDWEAICVDDASHDDTHAYLESIARDDRRFRVVRVPHGGLAATRNRGVVHAGAAFVLFLDADDRLTPDALTRMLAAARAAGSHTIVFGGLELIDQAGQTLGVYRFPGEDSFHRARLLHGNRLGPTALVPTHMLSERPFDESLQACEDWNLWLELAQRGVRAVLLPLPVLQYRLRRGSLGHRVDLMNASGRRVLARWGGGLIAARQSGLIARWSASCAALAAAGGEITRADELLPETDVLAENARLRALSQACEWAWEYVHGAVGETWRTHAGVWLGQIDRWLRGSLPHLADDVLLAIRGQAAGEIELLDRLRRALRERPQKKRLLVYGLGTRGLSLLQEIRRAPDLGALDVVAADDHAAAGRFTCLTLPRVDPQRWPRWPGDTLAIITPDQPDAMQRTLRRAGGRAGEDFLTLLELRAAPSPSVPRPALAMAEGA